MTKKNQQHRNADHTVLVTFVDPPDGWRYGFPKMISPIALYDLSGWLAKNGYPTESLGKHGGMFLRFWNDEVKLLDLEESYFNYVPDLKTQKSNFKKVGEFMSAMGQDIRTPKDARSLVPIKTIYFRGELIAEETQELFDELNPYSNIYSIDSSVHVTNMHRIAKELVDVLYVIYGTGHAFGIDLDKCFEEVHNSNLSKLGEDGKPVYREDGKVMKGPNYKPPDIQKVVYQDSDGKQQIIKDADDNGVRH